MAAASVSSAAKSVALKALHIRIYPTPADLAESREILKVLRRYGEISSYKSLKHEYKGSSPNTSLAIFKDSDAAQSVVRDSPLRFVLEPVEPEQNKEPSNPYLDLFNKLEAQHAEPTKQSPPQQAATPPHDQDTTHTTVTSTIPTASPSGQIEDQPTSPTNTQRAPQRPSRHFLVHASPWTSDLHEILQRAPYTGPFPIDTKSASQRDLAQHVPLPGLSRVELGRRPIPERLAEKRRIALSKRPKLRELMQMGGQHGDGVVGVPGMGEGAVEGKSGVRRGKEKARRNWADQMEGIDEHWDPSMMAPGVDRHGSGSEGHYDVQDEAARDRARWEQARRSRTSSGNWSRKYDRMI